MCDTKRTNEQNVKLTSKKKQITGQPFVMGNYNQTKWYIIYSLFSSYSAAVAFFSFACSAHKSKSTKKLCNIFLCNFPFVFFFFVCVVLVVLFIWKRSCFSLRNFRLDDAQLRIGAIKCHFRSNELMCAVCVCSPRN